MRKSDQGPGGTTCQCEHESHFSGSEHGYGRVDAIGTSNTPLGQFRMCSQCAFKPGHGVIHTKDNGSPALAPAPDRPRRPCPECGRDITVYRGKFVPHGEGRNGVTYPCPGESPTEVPDRLPDDIRNMKSRVKKSMRVWRP